MNLPNIANGPECMSVRRKNCFLFWNEKKKTVLFGGLLSFGTTAFCSIWKETIFFSPKCNCLDIYIYIYLASDEKWRLLESSYFRDTHTQIYTPTYALNWKDSKKRGNYKWRMERLNNEEKIMPVWRIENGERKWRKSFVCAMVRTFLQYHFEGDEHFQN